MLQDSGEVALLGGSHLRAPAPHTPTLPLLGTWVLLLVTGFCRSETWGSRHVAAFMPLFHWRQEIDVPLGALGSPGWVVSMPSACPLPGKSGCLLCLPTATKAADQTTVLAITISTTSSAIFIRSQRSEVMVPLSVTDRKFTGTSGPGLGEAQLPGWVCEEGSERDHVCLGH